MKFSGLVKIQATNITFDEFSVFQQYGDSPQQQYNLDTRLMYQQQLNHWQWEAHYQATAQKSNLPIQSLLNDVPAYEADQYRLWNLTRRITESDSVDNLQRIDRLNIRYSVDQWVAKIGRQAISWGHGLFFNPLDIANPFDPAVIDKEYKSGDDMLYLQGLQQNGNDIQFAIIPRRDEKAKINSAQSTYAAKYRGLWQNLDYDVLAAQHYNENLIGLGANIPFMEANVNSDWLVSRVKNGTERNWILMANLGVSYSWTGWNKNIIGRAEYFYNGFGLSESPISAIDVYNSEALTNRIMRGELYTLAKNYLAGGINIEIHPLFLLDINAFINLNDYSANLQILGNYNYSDYSNFSGGIILPIGPDGSEYGGLDSGINGYLSQQFSMFLKYTYFF